MKSSYFPPQVINIDEHLNTTSYETLLDDGSICVWENVDGQWATTSIIHTDAGRLIKLALSDDCARLYAAGADGCIRVYNRGDQVEPWKLQAVLSGHRGPIRALLLTSGFLCSASDDQVRHGMIVHASLFHFSYFFI